MRRLGAAAERVVEVIDARKAHLHATPDREVFVELPPELRRKGFCGRLRRCLYGTRDAPKRWEAYLSGELRKMGFLQGVASACCFQHKSRDVRCVVHGDDFVFVGCDADLAWIEQEMAKSFLTKVVGKLGGDAGDLKEIRVLNRVLRWTPEGITYEADPRHAEILARDWAPGGPAVKTAGVKPSASDAPAEEEPLSAHEVTHFRSGAARANYLAMDRADLSFATKELCRRMSGPKRSDFAALLRVIRFLIAEPRLVYNYKWQDDGILRVYCDTDFAGCLDTRKSTSGGCAMMGTHLVKHWSSTQKVVTLSSGEAELAGIVKGSSEALGLRSLCSDLGITTDLHVYADSSAAIGICRRSGIGRVRHLATGQLWVQERIRCKDFTLHKVLGTENPADAFTKFVPRDLLDQHMATMGLSRETGRAATAPQITVGS